MQLLDIPETKITDFLTFLKDISIYIDGQDEDVLI